MLFKDPRFWITLCVCTFVPVAFTMNVLIGPLATLLVCLACAAVSIVVVYAHLKWTGEL